MFVQCCLIGHLRIRVVCHAEGRMVPCTALPVFYPLVRVPSDQVSLHQLLLLGQIVWFWQGPGEWLAFQAGGPIEILYEGYELEGHDPGHDDLCGPFADGHCVADPGFSVNLAICHGAFDNAHNHGQCIHSRHTDLPALQAAGTGMPCRYIVQQNGKYLTGPFKTGILGNGYGETLRIWNFDTFVDDTEKFMKAYVAHSLEVLNNDEPLHIFGWPLFLPVCIARDYYSLWT